MFDPKQTRGMTLLEVCVSVGLLGMVITAIFGFYVLGLKLWGTNSSRSSILSSYHVANRTLGRFVSESNSAGTSIDNDAGALSLINSRDSLGEPSLAPDGRRLWQGWEIFYREGDTLKRTRLDWSASAADRETVTPMEVATGLSLAGAVSGADGRLVASHIYQVEFFLEPDGASLRVELEFRKASRQKPQGEKFQTTTVLRYRN